MVEAALHRNVSLVAFQQGDFASALEHAEASIRAEPQNLKSKFRRATALHALGRLDEAAKETVSVSDQKNIRASYVKILQYVLA